MKEIEVNKACPVCKSLSLRQTVYIKGFITEQVYSMLQAMDRCEDNGESAQLIEIEYCGKCDFKREIRKIYYKPTALWKR